MPLAREALNDPPEIPRELDRWNWGAFLLNWIWGIGNSTFIALLALIPLVNLVMMIVLGLRGSRWAWKNRAWRDADHFRKSQRGWAIAGLIIWAIVIGIPAFLFSSVPFSLKSNEAYVMTMEAVRNDPAVKVVLGDNIEDAFWISGNLSINANGSGVADFGIPVTGSNGSGRVLSHAVRTGGEWSLRLVVVRVEGSETPIVVINEDDVPIPNAAIDT